MPAEKPTGFLIQRIIYEIEIPADKASGFYYSDEDSELL